jgi:restriction system protein
MIVSENEYSQILTSSFTGREKELETLTHNLVSGNVRVASIIGGRGVGKTTLARFFSKIYEQRLWGEAFGIYASSFGSISNRVLNDVPNNPHPLLIIIDEFHLLPEQEIDSELQRILVARPTARILAISQSRVPSSKIELTIELENFSLQEMSELIHKRFGHQLGSTELRKLYEVLRGNPLATNMSSDALRDNIFTLEQLLESSKPFTITSLIDAAGKPLEPDSQSYKIVVADVKTVSDELLRKLSENPKLLYELSPRLFEEVVAELFSRQGYEVELTPYSRDGGKDIYVASKNLLGSFLYVVECKKYSPDNPVGVGLIRQLYGVVQAEKATAGILATTSFFTKDAKEFQQKLEFQISLQDYFGIQKLLNAASKH